MTPFNLVPSSKLSLASSCLAMLALVSSSSSNASIRPQADTHFGPNVPWAPGPLSPEQSYAIMMQPGVGSPTTGAPTGHVRDPLLNTRPGPSPCPASSGYPPSQVLMPDSEPRRRLDQVYMHAPPSRSFVSLPQLEPTATASECSPTVESKPGKPPPPANLRSVLDMYKQCYKLK